MEYASFLRGENDDFHWEGDVPATQEDIFNTQGPIESLADDMMEAGGDIGGTSGRGQSYSLKEDILLVSAWLNVSLDPVVGSNQSREAFWKRVEAYYQNNKDFPSTRNKKSLQGRWSTINTMVQKFCGYYAQAVRAKQSGTTDEETLVEACKRFKDKEQKEFTFLHCWRELRHHPKWIDESSRKRQKTSDRENRESQQCESTPIINVDSVDGTPDSAGPSRQTRPPGRNRSKQMSRGSTDSMSTSSPIAELAERQLALKSEVEKVRAAQFAEMMAVERQKLKFKEERMELERLREEKEIMNMDLSKMSEDQQAYYSALRQSIIAARRASAGPSV